MIYQDMRSPELTNVNREKTVVVIPLAAVEQHGPHMPTGTDSILCSAIASALEKKRTHDVLLLPTFWLGASSHHLRFGATLDLRLRTLIDMLNDCSQSLLDDGFKRILILNGHGGNVDPIKIALREIQPQHRQTLLVGGSYWSVASEFVERTLEGEHKFVGHACEFETSLMLHLRPELVDVDTLNPAGKLIDDQIDGLYVSRDMMQRTNAGFTGRPDLATQSKGAVLFDGIVAALESLIGRIQNQVLGERFTDFYS